MRFGLLRIELQSIVGHLVIGTIKTGLKSCVQKTAVVTDKEVCSRISKEDSAVWRKNTRQVINEEGEKSRTKNGTLWDTRSCGAGKDVESDTRVTCKRSDR